MKKISIYILILCSLLSAKDIYPSFVLKSVGFVSDFAVDKDKLYAVNDEGSIDIFDLSTRKIIEQVFLEPIVTRQNIIKPQKIISIDKYENKLLIVSIGKSGYRNVWEYKNHSLTKIIDENKKLTIKEALYLDNDKILLSTFGAEIILYNSKEKFNIYKTHISQSSLSDISLSKDKKTIFMSDESGEIKIINATNSKIKKKYSSQNVDNVFHIASSNGVLITAGQDRRVGVYQEGVADYHIKSDFLVYCVGISPSGINGIYSSGEDNILQIFNTKNAKKLDKLIGHKSVVNQIKFINEKQLFSAGRENNIFFWEI